LPHRVVKEENKMATTLTLNVNGRTHKLSVDDPETPLLWVLRDTLAQCGACLVHVNGEPTLSCITQITQVAGKKITTIEGLSRAGNHPVQKAWVAEQVPQCGYCQSGLIMSAAALLAKNKNPSDAEIDQAMIGHICTCGTYNRIRKAIHTAASMMGKGA